jgi:hypothetical protein
MCSYALHVGDKVLAGVSRQLAVRPREAAAALVEAGNEIVLGVKIAAVIIVAARSWSAMQKHHGNPQWVATGFNIELMN